MGCESLKIHGVEILRCAAGRVRGVLEILARVGGFEYRATLFSGRGYYRAWAELWPFSFSEEMRGSLVSLARALLTHMGPGSRLMIPYEGDPETLFLLDRGAPPAATPLGSILVVGGFTLLRNMYYPEGFAEGSPKLSGENCETGSWCLRALVEEISELRSYVGTGCPGSRKGCGLALSSLEVLESLVRGS